MSDGDDDGFGLLTELRSPTCKLYLDLMSELVKKEKTNSGENESSASGAKPVSSEKTSETETKNKNGESESKDFTGMSDDSIIDEIKRVLQKIEAEDFDSVDLEEVVLMATYHSKHQSYVKYVKAEVCDEWSWGDFEGDVHEDIIDFVDFVTVSGQYTKNGHAKITPEEPNEKPENVDTEGNTKTSEMMDDNDQLKNVEPEPLETTKAIQDRTETTATAEQASELENNQLESEKENNQPKNNTDPDPSGLRTAGHHP